MPPRPICVIPVTKWPRQSWQRTMPTRQERSRFVRKQGRVWRLVNAANCESPNHWQDRAMRDKARSLHTSVDSYFKSMNQVEGWFPEPSPTVFLLLHQLQEKIGVIGDLFEIGVYKGKSAILLGHLARPSQNERLLFDDTFHWVRDGSQ